MPTDPAASGPSLADLRKESEEGLRQAELAFQTYQSDLKERESKMGNKEAEEERKKQSSQKKSESGSKSNGLPPVSAAEQAERDAAAAKIQALQKGRKTRQDKDAGKGKFTGKTGDPIDAALAALQRGGAAWPGNLDANAVLSACSDLLKSISSIDAAERPAVNDARASLISARDLTKRWCELFPKESDGSVRIPGGDFLRFDAKSGKLHCGDFAPFVVRESEDEMVVSFCASGEGERRVLREDEDGDPTEIDFEAIELAQPFARSVLKRMGIASVDGSGDDREWDELMKWLGADALCCVLKIKK